VLAVEVSNLVNRGVGSGSYVCTYLQPVF
jgi:hypothetical protein